MTTKKVGKPVRPLLGYVLMTNTNVDFTVDEVGSLSTTDVDLHTEYTKEEIESEINEYDGQYQLLVGEVRISNIVVRALKEV